MGGWCAARPLRFLAAWLVVTGAVVTLSITVGGSYRDSRSLPGTEVAAADDRLQAHFPSAADTSADLLLYDASCSWGGYVFGLSMDYEVFLLPRVREEWVMGRDGRESVVGGLASTAQVTSAAAAIMVAVFLAFTLSDGVVVKTIGLGMAVAVLLGPTVIRLVFVPATMALLGDLNWWVPRWLDTVLPHIDTVLPHVDTVLPGPLAVLRQETEVPIPRPTP